MFDIEPFYDPATYTLLYVVYDLDSKDAVIVDSVLRDARDATLQVPRLLWSIVQVNIDAGRMPAEHENGVRYLRVPLNLKKPVENDGTPRAAR